MGMASLLTAPLVSDSVGEDSVSLNLVAEMLTIACIIINQCKWNVELNFNVFVLFSL